MNPESDDTDFASVPAQIGGGAFDRLAQVLAAVGTLWIFGLMFLVVADVVGRNFLDRPITGVAEFAARSVAAIVFLQLASAILAGKMTRSDFVLRLVGRRSPRAVAVLEVGIAVVGALLFAALAYVSWPEWALSWTGNEYFGVQGVFTIPTWPFRGLLVLGSLVAALAYLMTIPAFLRRGRAGAGAAP